MSISPSFFYAEMVTYTTASYKESLMKLVRTGLLTSSMKQALISESDS